MKFSFRHPYSLASEYDKPVAYFCMEFAIHQSLKLYAGGLGFLAGSHMRSGFELRQNMVGIGILWKYGYYDQVRKSDQGMDVLFQEKVYAFLKKTDIRFTIQIAKHNVWVTAYYLPPEVFQTVPIFFLSTDLPENDYLAKTISHRLYDSNPETQIAAAVLLGVGGAKLLEHLEWEPQGYHLNESHGLPLAFYLYNKYKDLQEVRKRLVFTNHTPEEGGNRKTDMHLLEKMGFFCEVPTSTVKDIAQSKGDSLNHTLTALRFGRVSNGVSKLHRETLIKMWKGFEDINQVLSITNAQNFRFWHDHEMYKALRKGDDDALWKRKSECKEQLFEVVADQNGEIFHKDILTIVFAKRFAGYKRPELLLRDPERFEKLVCNKDMPVQIIWAGKPYPMDYTSIATFDRIVEICKSYSNCSILVGYELKLSKLLKMGADIWLNTPRMSHEASGTSGMAAAMNGAVNVSIPDGWFPEFARNKVNGFIIPPSDPALPDHRQDDEDADSLYDILEKEVIPAYYGNRSAWLSIIKNSMQDIVPYFDSNRMADEYYSKMYVAASSDKIKNAVSLFMAVEQAM